jgi:hypothetical protein
MNKELDQDNIHPFLGMIISCLPDLHQHELAIKKYILLHA